jgi:hypothetical protein
LGRASASAIATFFLRSMGRGPRPAKVEEPASVLPTSRQKQVPRRLWVCGLMPHGRMGRIASAEIVRLPFLPNASWTMVSRGRTSERACGSFRSPGERFCCKFFSSRDRVALASNYPATRQRRPDHGRGS